MLGFNARVFITRLGHPAPVASGVSRCHLHRVPHFTVFAQSTSYSRLITCVTDPYSPPSSEPLPQPSADPSTEPIVPPSTSPSISPLTSPPPSPSPSQPPNSTDKGGSGSGSGSGSGGDGTDNSDEGEKTPQYISLDLPFIDKRLNALLNSIFLRFQKALLAFLGAVLAVFNQIPISILTAFITATASLLGVLAKAHYDALNADMQRQEAEEKRKGETEAQLRRAYDQLATPVLQAAAKLAERLHLLLDMQWDIAESAREEAGISPLYSTYLVARYFATVEILKEERPLLDYGFPAADRILYNILGRIQGVFGANDQLLDAMQKTELFFKPARDESTLPAGLLRITPHVQTDVGFMLLRRLWSKKNKDVEGGQPTGSTAILSFSEFERLFHREGELQTQLQPLMDDFTALEDICRTRRREQRRSADVGARAFFLQSALVDLVGFFDPLPNTRTVPTFRRQRVRINTEGEGSIQRLPNGLQQLFHELALIRDHKGNDVDHARRPEMPRSVEVYVAGRSYARLRDGELAPTDVGECPLSHRMLLVLHEMGIPHKAVTIARDCKPPWYYLLHPDNRTPLLYHDGQVVDEPMAMIGYLGDHFPNCSTLMSTQHLNLPLNTEGLTSFHPHFLRWLRGDVDAQGSVERELRGLDRLLQRVQADNKGKPFLGGSSFSAEDTMMVPYLHNVDVAGRLMKQWKIPVECKAVRSYLTQARRRRSFVETVPSDTSVVEGYSGMIVKGEWNVRWRLADML